MKPLKSTEIITEGIEIESLGLSWWSSGKESTFQFREHGFDPWLGN